MSSLKSARAAVVFALFGVAAGTAVAVPPAARIVAPAEAAPTGHASASELRPVKH